MQRDYPIMTELEHQLHGNLARVMDRIGSACERSKREASEVTLVAVTKSVGVEVVRSLCRLGVRDLGENRVQQLCERCEEIGSFVETMRLGHGGGRIDRPRWHMIGHLQRNKVRSLVPWVSMVQSVDRLRLAEELNKRAAERSMVIDVLLEVNGGGEAQKTGAAVCAAGHLGEQVESMPHLRLRGLMSMAPMGADESTLRLVLGRVGELYEEMRHDFDVGDSFDVLSMGMSGDFEIAVECGATMVRVGSALYEGMNAAEVVDES
jgi:PLP dependent protein